MARKYTRDFKIEVCKLITEDNVKLQVVADKFSLNQGMENLGIAASTLHDWLKKADVNDGKVPTRGSGNYSSDEAKKCARLKRELRDTKDALDILHQRRAVPKKP